jgi:predicted amidohydrolase YtcJ
MRLALFAFLALAVPAQHVTSVVVNGRVWTGDPARPWAEAVAISGSTIRAVGSTAEITKGIPASVVRIDAKGGLVAPGFIDSHIHFLTGGRNLSSVQLRDAKTKEQFIARIRDFAKTVPPGTWITGGDWDHENWGGELPSRGWIDSVTPNHPVWVNRLDGHMSLANSKALAFARVTREVKEIEGGEIVRDANGEPTGLLKDNAMSLVNRAVPPRSPEMGERALLAAMNHVAAQGVTSVVHVGTWDDLAVFERAHKAGKLKTRVYAAVPLATWSRLREKVLKEGKGDEWLRIGGLKAYVDGSLGSHTAAFLEPYTDKPSDKGLLVIAPDKLYQQVAGAAKAGLQVMVHAIGDSAIRTQLDIFERVKKEQNLADPRFRIEHAQHIARTDIPRFARIGVIASMQPYHAIDDGRWADKVIGAERSRTTYAFRSLLDAKARLAFGSDWFVAPPTPLEGIYAAVTRRTLDGRNPNGWVPAEKITVEESLKAYTSEAAYATFEESRKGVLRPGYLADLVVIDRDLMRMDPAQIRDAKVRITMVGGKVVYEAR